MKFAVTPTRARLGNASHSHPGQSSRVFRRPHCCDRRNFAGFDSSRAARSQLNTVGQSERDADRFLGENAGGFKTTATRGVGERLCAQTSCPFGEQHRAATDGLHPGGQGGRVRGRRNESAWLRRAAGKSNGAPLVARNRNGGAHAISRTSSRDRAKNSALRSRRKRRDS